MLEKLPFYNQMTLPYHFAKAVVAGVKYKLPARGLRVIGVTGTNGKTTTCFMLWKMLNEAGHKAGLMTTVAWGVDKLNDQMEHMTTVDSETLNSRISQIKAAGAEFLVLEVTSHAMAQFRTLGVPIEIAVMTNVTHEHLDYHKTFENYRDAKRKLFKKAKFGVINADDKSAKFFEQDVKEYITYGINKGEKRAKEVELGADGVKYSCGDMKIRTNIPGEFNVYNSLAAMCVGEKLGLSNEEIEKGIFALEEVKGRMTKIEEGQDFSVIVDYAHTPDSFEKLFKGLDKPKGKVIVMFGSAGRRDETKRAVQGEIAGKYADVVVLTEEDDRDVPGEEILAQIAGGAEKSGKVKDRDLFLILDRTEAIEATLKMAKKGDLVLLLGKGHEKTIERKNGENPWDEIGTTKKVLRKLVKAK